MNIFYTVNDKYVPQLAAGITSICENNKKADRICFFVASMGITEDNKNKLKEMTEAYGDSEHTRTVEIIEIVDLKSKIGFDFDTNGWNEIVLARLLVDKLLPEDVEKVLYLDGDTICVGPLDELWNMDMDGKAIGGSIEPTANRKRKEDLGLKGRHYINAGVLLIDLKRWREIQCGRTILEYYSAHAGNLFANDQDAINGSLNDEIKIIPMSYNFYNIFWYYPYRSLKKMEAPGDYFSKEDYKKYKASPRIIHYLGEDQPWREGCSHRFKADYWKYLEMTPWKDQKLEGGWKTFLVCYKIFIGVLWIFPMLRYKIMDSLIPAVMSYRKKKRLQAQHR